MKTDFLAICDNLRKDPDGELFWSEMMFSRSRITEANFLKYVDITQLPVLDADETWNDYRKYAGNDLQFYQSSNAFFFQVAGFEFIWSIN